MNKLVKRFGYTYYCMIQYTSTGSTRLGYDSLAIRLLQVSSFTIFGGETQVDKDLYTYNQLKSIWNE